MDVAVNGKRIDEDAIHREMQYHPAASLAEAREAAARALVVRELMLGEARRRGVTPDPRPGEAEDEALVRWLIEHEITVTEPDDSSCRRYYEKNRGILHTPLVHVVSHILLMVPEDALAREQADRRARELLREIDGDVARFAEFARQYSDCPSRTEGGHLGRIGAGNTVPEFERALARLQPGEIAPAPIETRYGYHIVYVQSRAGGEPYSYEQARPRIAAYLRESAHRRALMDYVRRLADDAQIKGLELAE